LRKSQRFGKSLETSGSRIFFLRYLKSIGCYGFSYGFLAVLNLFHQCFILIFTNIHSIKCPLPPLPCFLSRSSPLHLIWLSYIRIKLQMMDKNCIPYTQCCGSGMFIPVPGSGFLSIPDP
jgi:hypothetical protein